MKNDDDGICSFLDLEVRRWCGDEWPERRISLGCSTDKHAVMISPRYADLDVAERDAKHIAKCVNNHYTLLAALEKFTENSSCQANMPYECSVAEDLINKIDKE